MTAVSVILETTTLSLGGTSYTDQVGKIELTIQVEEKDVTTFAALGAKVIRGGLESGSLKVTFENDYTDNGLDEVMWTALKSKTPITFATRITSGAISASNPEFTGYVLVNKWTPINGGPGDDAKVEVDFPTSGPTTRDVTP
jgi:hypothetical protein